MKIKWNKIIIAVLDLALAVYLVMAFTSFNKPDTSKDICQRVNIGIDDGETNGFIDAKEIKKRLSTSAIYPQGKRMDSVSTRQIEEKLRRSAFVKTAECYKTQDGQVYINITQRLPVIRIKADNGDDYYIDDKHSIMPNSSYTSDLIIATGHISRSFATNYIAQMGVTLMGNDLWKNLIEQIHVLPNNAIELVPRIGDHIIYIGKLPEIGDKTKREKTISDFITTKMTRLEKFYRYGLSHAGWNKYDFINIEFDNQIICKKRSAIHEEPQQPIATAEQTNGQQHDNAATTTTQQEQQAEETNAKQQKKHHKPWQRNS